MIRKIKALAACAGFIAAGVILSDLTLLSPLILIHSLKSLHDMKTYNVVFSFNGETISDFAVFANNLKQAKEKAQFSKRCYCTHDKPESIPANRIKVTTKYVTKEQEYNY